MVAIVDHQTEHFGPNVRETQYVFQKRMSEKNSRRYNALMFNTISPNVVQLLRERTGFRQTDFAKAQPNRAQEMRILEISRCSKEVDFRSGLLEPGPP